MSANTGRHHLQTSSEGNQVTNNSVGNSGNMRQRSMADGRSCPDVIDVSPYDSYVLTIWDAICLKGMRIFAFPFDSFLSCFMPTTEELKRPLHRYIYVFLGIPLWLFLSVMALPIGTIFLLLWIPVCQKRRHYRYSHVADAKMTNKGKVKTSFTCSTLNVCLLHEFLTRFNNQSNTYYKAVNIGRNVAAQQQGRYEEYEQMTTRDLTTSVIETMRDEKLRSIGAYQQKIYASNSKRKQHWTPTNGHSNNNRQLNKNRNGSKKRTRQNHGTSHADLQESRRRSKPANSTAFDHSILSEFPPQDFLLIQETFDLASARALAAELHHVFPYIVYDARVDSFSSNLFCSNSGTMIASRYPILETRFDYYRDSLKQCRLASKGLLQVKVDVGRTSQGKQAVGFLATTHLQAYQGTVPVHSWQLNDVLRWADDFRRTSVKDNEIVVFDIVGGDFNTDNMSPVDKVDWDHKIFEVYVDVCRVRPGRDHPWTVGTEMRHTPLHDPLIQTPLGLQLALVDDYLRQHYVLDAAVSDAVFDIAHDMPPRDRHGNEILSPVGGRRRIDYVIYRDGDPVRVSSCNPVTQLAGLTDHIPYSLTFDVTV